MQGWLDQYQEESMMTHIYASLQGYLGRWVCSLKEDGNLTIPELLVHMDCAFGDMSDYDAMIRSCKRSDRRTVSPWKNTCYEFTRLWW